MAKQTSPLQPLPESLSLSLQPWPWHCHIVGAPFTETAVSGLHNLMTAPCFGGTWWGLSSNSFASALLPILSHISYPVLWISWGEGKCLLHLCRLLDIHRVTTDHSDIYLVSCSTELESPGCGWVSVSHLLPHRGIAPSALTKDLSCQFPRGVGYSSYLSLVRVKAIVVFIRHWGHND